MTAREEKRVRRWLRSRLPYVRHLALIASDSAEGRDPSDAVEFLRRLRRLVDDTLRRVA
jgi:hypothetical protein